MKKEDIKVSVFCTAFNHEQFLRKCLDGFVMQKTNFKFEVIVNDDASTDGTKKIIEEYVEKYPDIIIPIYQTENQYSQGVDIIDDIIFPVSKGKYIAICEGDDFWCDENKLQLQYDFMEEHAECSACFHNVIRRDLSGICKDFNFNSWKDIHFMTPEEVIDGNYVQTSAYFVRREFMLKDDYQRNYKFGDYVTITRLLLKGKLAVLPQVMSVYNANNTNGMVYKIHKSLDINKWSQEERKLCDYLFAYNEKSNYIYNELILTKIISIDFLVVNEQVNYYLKNNHDKKSYKILLKRLKNHPYYPIYKNKNKGINKLKTFIKFHSPYFIHKMWLRFKGRK